MVNLINHNISEFASPDLPGSGLNMSEELLLRINEIERIAEIKLECKAKIAEKQILIEDKELLAKEIVTLEEKRDRNIEKVYQESK